MPGIAWAYIVAWGLTLGSAFTDKTAPIWGRVDHNARSGGRINKPIPFTIGSSAPIQIARLNVRGVEECRNTVTAVTGWNRVMRLRIDGNEQLLDTSWSHTVTSSPFERRKVIVRYLNPVGGKELACHTISYLCTPQNGWDGSVRAEVSYGEPCLPPAGPQRGQDQSGKPALKIRPVSRVFANHFVQTGTGGFMAGATTVVAEVTGKITEEWYCPRVEWEVPDVEGEMPSITHKVGVRESDCPPYTPELAEQQTRRYTQTFALPEGVWTIRVRLYHGDKVIASQSVMVTIG